MNGLARHRRRARGRFALRFGAATDDWTRLKDKKRLSETDETTLKILAPGNRRTRRAAAAAYQVKP